jgi:hypothetical protein
MTLLSIMTVVIMNEKLVGVSCVHITLYKMWVSHNFPPLMTTNTLTHVVVRGVVLNSRYISQLQMDPLVFLLDALRLIGD